MFRCVLWKCGHRHSANIKQSGPEFLLTRNSDVEKKRGEIFPQKPAQKHPLYWCGTPPRQIFLISKPRPTEGVGHLWRGGCGGRPGAYPPPTDLAHRIWVTARAPSALRRPSSTPRSGGRATGGAKRRSYLASSEGVFVLHCKLHGIDLCNLLILARQTQINKDLGVLPDRKSGI
jgi:hypothetical protein